MLGIFIEIFRLNLYLGMINTGPEYREFFIFAN